MLCPFRQRIGRRTREDSMSYRPGAACADCDRRHAHRPCTALHASRIAAPIVIRSRRAIRGAPGWTMSDEQPQAIRILFVEDLQVDADLRSHQLKRAGISTVLEPRGNRTGLIAALRRFRADADSFRFLAATVRWHVGIARSRRSVRPMSRSCSCPARSARSGRSTRCAPALWTTC